MLSRVSSARKYIGLIINDDAIGVSELSSHP